MSMSSTTTSTSSPQPKSPIPIKSPILPFAQYSEHVQDWNGEMHGANHTDDTDDQNHSSPIFWLSPIAAELSLHVYDTSQPLPLHVELVTWVVDPASRENGTQDPFDFALEQIDELLNNNNKSKGGRSRPSSSASLGSDTLHNVSDQVDRDGTPASTTSEVVLDQNMIVGPSSSPTTTPDPTSAFVALYQYSDPTTSPPTQYWFLATRGTATTDDWTQNALQVAGISDHYTNIARFAHKLQRRASQSTIQLIFTGHSKGGGHAALNSMVTGSGAITFNAAGVSELTKAKVLSLLEVDASGLSPSSSTPLTLHSDAPIYSFWSLYDPLVNISKYLATAKVGEKIGAWLGLAPLEIGSGTTAVGGNGEGEMFGSNNANGGGIVIGSGEQEAAERAMDGSSELIQPAEGIDGDGNNNQGDENGSVLRPTTTTTMPTSSPSVTTYSSPTTSTTSTTPFQPATHSAADLFTTVYTNLGSWISKMGSIVFNATCEEVAKEVVRNKFLSKMNNDFSKMNNDLIKLMELISQRSHLTIPQADGRYKFTIVHHQDETLILCTTINYLQRWYSGEMTKGDVAMGAIQTVIDQHSMSETLLKFKKAFEDYKTTQRLQVGGGQQQMSDGKVILIRQLE